MKLNSRLYFKDFKKTDGRSFDRLFNLCAGHGTVLAGESPVAGIYRKCSEPQAGIGNGPSVRSVNDNLRVVSQYMILFLNIK